MRQKFRLSEIRAEDYAFVLLSRTLNILEEQVLQPVIHLSMDQRATTYSKE